MTYINSHNKYTASLDSHAVRNSICMVKSANNYKKYLTFHINEYSYLKARIFLLKGTIIFIQRHENSCWKARLLCLKERIFLFKGTNNLYSKTRLFLVKGTIIMFKGTEILV